MNVIYSLVTRTYLCFKSAIIRSVGCLDIPNTHHPSFLSQHPFEENKQVEIIDLKLKTNSTYERVTSYVT